MGVESVDFLSREELLGGLPARRASTLLFAIESRTAHLVARSRRAMARFVTEKTAEERERAFLDALAQGREPPVRPTIQDLERYAPEWASLVPTDAGVRAAVARMLGEKYLVPERSTPAIRRALGLDDEEVRRAYQRLHGEPLSSISAARLPRRERLRWVRSRAARRLETLPPFWTAFALTLTETVGAGILALPIAFATVGPLAGVVLLVVLGLVNMLTIAAMAEAVARNGGVRYGRAYFGRLVGDYLGRPGTLILTPALMLLMVIAVLAYFIGLSTTLADAVGAPAALWAALLFVVILIVLRRESLDATVASALLVGAAGITLIVLLSLLALPSVSGANLRHAEIPFRDGAPFEASLLELVFGIVLLAFFGHTSVANCAAVVLERDPSARALIRGSTAALGAALLLYALWVVAVNGAVGPVALAAESGTALGPLAAEVGPSIRLFGSLFAVLAMGMASIHTTLGLFNQVKEWLPTAQGRAGGGRSRRRDWVASRWGRFALGMAPGAAVLLLVEVLLITDRESFAGPLAVLGVITVPIVAGVFPMLMLAAARRKGDCAIADVGRFLGHPIVVAGTVLVFLAGILVHGLAIWEEPYLRVLALLVAAIVAVVSLACLRAGALTPRAVIELRLDPGRPESTVVNVVAGGRPASAQVELTRASPDRSAWRRDGNAATDGLRSAVIHLPPVPVRELKVWAHRRTDEGDWEALPASLAVWDDRDVRRFELGSADGQVVMPVIEGGTHRLELTLAREDPEKEERRR